MWTFQLVPSGTLQNNFQENKMPAWPVCPAGWQSWRPCSSGFCMLVAEWAWRNLCLLGSQTASPSSSWARSSFPRLAPAGSLPSWPLLKRRRLACMCTWIMDCVQSFHRSLSRLFTGIAGVIRWSFLVEFASVQCTSVQHWRSVLHTVLWATAVSCFTSFPL